MRTALLITLLLTGIAQTPPPDTEVFLASLGRDGARLSLGTPQNISTSPGYDNQPSFSPDGRSVYFTSARGGGSPAQQMDIYRYDVDTRKIVQVTRTAESEYSATVTPDKRHISVVRVEADKTQRLWKFPLSGDAPSLVLTDIKPVGYHAWLDEHTLALFVLGQPATLQIADVRTGTAVTAARDIGRSLQPIPGGGVSFLQRTDGPERTWRVAEVTLKDGKPAIVHLTDAAPGSTEEFVAWTPDGTLLMAGGQSLHAWRRGQKQWTPAAEFPPDVRGVSRLAVSPRGDRLAFVASN